MNLTLEQWRELEAMKAQAMDALKSFEDKLCDLMMQHTGETASYIGKASHRAFEAQQVLSSIDVHVVSEWMGGDSSDPKNFKLREPQATGLSNRKYF